MVYVVFVLVLAVISLIMVNRSKTSVANDYESKIEKIEEARNMIDESYKDLQRKFEENLSTQDQKIKEAREDSVKRSKSTISGKVAETFAPFLPDFPYNPKDCRFLGTPNDFIVFDGMDEGTIKEVIILEIKSGKSSLSTRQRDLRNALNDGRVRWEEFKV